MSLQSARLTVKCAINGRGPYALALDTGAIVGLIQEELASELDMRRVGKVHLGVAGVVDDYTLFQARDIVFQGGIRNPAPSFAATSHVQFGEGVVGSLAAGVLSAVDSELDFTNLDWIIYPEGSPDRSDWVRHEKALLQRSSIGGSAYLFADGVIGTVPFRGAIDTGALTPIRLFEKLSRKSGLLSEDLKWSPTGKRGQTIIRTVRSPQPLTIGGLHLARPLISLQSEGTHASPYEDALIGLPLIQQLNLATDVKAGTLWTRPSGRIVEERYNLSGLWIDQRSDRLIVGAVGRGSPAQEAGIAVGDEVVGNSFKQLIQQLNGEAGQMVSFNIRRKSVTRSMELTLEDYL